MDKNLLFKKRESIAPSDAEDDHIDLHISILPSTYWNNALNCAPYQTIAEAITIGFIRCHLLSSIIDLRSEINQQLSDDNDIPKNFIFLKGVGRALVAIRPKQEKVLTVQNFKHVGSRLPPEICILSVDGNFKPNCTAKMAGMAVNNLSVKSSSKRKLSQDKILSNEVKNSSLELKDRASKSVKDRLHRSKMKIKEKSSNKSFDSSTSSPISSRSKKKIPSNKVRFPPIEFENKTSENESEFPRNYPIKENHKQIKNRTESPTTDFVSPRMSKSPVKSQVKKLKKKISKSDSRNEEHIRKSVSNKPKILTENNNIQKRSSVKSKNFKYKSVTIAHEETDSIENENKQIDENIKPKRMSVVVSSKHENKNIPKVRESKNIIAGKPGKVSNQTKDKQKQQPKRTSIVEKYIPKLPETSENFYKRKSLTSLSSEESIKSNGGLWSCPDCAQVYKSEADKKRHFNLIHKQSIKMVKAREKLIRMKNKDIGGKHVPSRWGNPANLGEIKLV